MSCILESPFGDDELVCWVLSEAARDGTALNVENRLDVRLDETWKEVCVSLGYNIMKHVSAVADLSWYRHHSHERIEVRLTLGAIMGREDSME